jgi:HD-GYP domain-containing protein (c-di-GMP phosphodiesterase class II)
MPNWLFFFLGRSLQTNEHDLLSAFPYLSCFIDDAQHHWQKQQSHPISSGSWIEMDELDQEIAMEASALWIDNSPVLVLQNLGEKYQQEVRQLQKVRDGLLTKEMLEAEVKKRTLQIKQREEDLAVKLVSLTSYRDEETGAHVRRIGLYAAAMAKALNWSQDRIDDIRIAAPMHDIGKIGIPDKILLKAGKLTDNEFSIMQRHTEIGAQMLKGSNIPVLDMAADIAMNHHERWDGEGYPQGLSGKEIPTSARITTIVDVYDALVHERVYKKAMCEKEAIQLMSKMRGKNFDPKLFDLFVSLLPVMRRIRTQVHEIQDLLVCEVD